MAGRSLDELASRFHDRLKAVKDRTRLEGGEWYPWRSLNSIQMLGREMGVSVDRLSEMIGNAPVVDAGCGDGDVAFFLETLGARVDAVDHPSTNYNRMEGARVLKQALGSNVVIHVTDIDARPVFPSSQYGMAMLLGVLYHLKNPFLALEALAQNSRWLYMSTRIAAVTPDRRLRFGAYPMAYLVDDRELNDDPTNFWIFSEGGFKRLVRRAGWKEVGYFTLGRSAADSDPVSEDGDVRAFILAESRFAIAENLKLGRGWHELEYGSSRWTERQFSASIDVPQTLLPATLRFVFHIPDALIAARPKTLLCARINGLRLPAAEYSTPGEHEYSATIASVPEGRVEIEFELGAAARIGSDERDLGVQVYFTREAPIQLK